MKQVCLIMLLLCLSNCFALSLIKDKTEKKGERSMKLTSPAFEHNSVIPIDYTCEGPNESPELHWDNVPEQTKSFVLICDDPDAPKKTWVHWVVFNLPANKRFLKRNEPIDEAHLGINDFGKFLYGGPCPPEGHGMHHYHFKLYALDTELNLGPEAKKEDVVKAMKGHILDQAELVGLYERK